MTIAALPGLSVAQPAPVAPDGLRLDPPVIVVGEGGSYVARNDDAEIQKRGKDDPGLLWFRNGASRRTEPGIDPAAPSPLAGILIVQFPGPVSREGLEAVAKLGIVTRDHIQNHALLVEVPPGAGDGLTALVQQGVVRYVGPYPIEAKLDKALAADAVCSESAEEPLVTVVLMGPSQDARARISALMAIEREAGDPIPFVRGRVPAVRLPDLAALDRVKWVEPYEPGEVQNLEAGMSGAADAVAAWGSFRGGGIRVATDDSGISRTGTLAECGGAGANYHPDIASWRIADEWDFENGDANACDDNSHGTHVAGTIGGNGTLLDAWAGIAPDVTFLIYKESNAGGGGFGHFDGVLSRAASHDADIVGNSWGGGANGSYDINSQWADRAVRGTWNGSDGQPQRMFLTVSTGNDNDLATPPSTGKNVVAVGATKDGNVPDGVWCWGAHNCNFFPGCSCTPTNSCGDRYWPQTETICFSNYGPVDTDGDGNSRVKPDVVAPGTRIFSLAPPYLGAGYFYRFSDGTSMAQPVVAGTVALINDAYPSTQGWPEVVKARLLGSAMDMGNRNLFGHGLVDAVHAIYTSGTMISPLWTGAEITGTNHELDFTFNVPAGFSEARVYLTWSDPDSSTTEVVNDLDLRVYDGAGSLIAYSNSYDDTVESVRVTSGTPGDWRANVRGYNVPQPNARFGIYAGVVTTPTWINFSASPDDTCVKPGAWMEVQASLTNAGHSVPASEATLDFPAGGNFILHNIEIHPGDPARSHVYQAAEVRHDPATDAYTVYLGQVHPNVPRSMTWRMQPSTGAPDGLYGLILWGKAYGQLGYGDVVNVRVDGTVPTGPLGLVSTTHPAGTCWRQNYVWMTWTAASDGGCGLDGYGHSWSLAAPEVPAAAKTIEESTTLYYEWVPESTWPWYFNLRPVDNAGNWSSSGVSYGPFWIDTTAPGPVGAVASETHPPYACTDQPSVAIFWSHASDDNCGMAGYSYGWSDWSPSLPDEYADIGMEDHLSATLGYSDAARYFNIRAVDVAGNPGGYTSHGPFWVDQVPGAVGGLLAERLGSDLRLAWNRTENAHVYRVYKDTSPWFPAPVQVGPDTDATSLLEPGGATTPARIEFFRVLGTNVCGKPGPM